MIFDKKNTEIYYILQQNGDKTAAKQLQTGARAIKHDYIQYGWRTELAVGEM